MCLSGNENRDFQWIVRYRIRQQIVCLLVASWVFYIFCHGLQGHQYVHYDYVIMGSTASQITSLTIVYSTVYSGADQGKYQSSALLAFVRGIHRRPVNSPHKLPVTQKMFLFDDVIMDVLKQPRRRRFQVSIPINPADKCVLVHSD